MAVDETMKPGAKALSPWAAAGKVFWAPTTVFRLVRERAPIAPVYIVQMVLGVLYGIPSTIKLQRAAALEPQSMFNMQAGVWAYMVFDAVLLPWVSGLVLALFLRLSGLLLPSENQPSFRQYFAAAGYIRMTAVLSAILSLPLQIRNWGVENALHDIDELLSLLVFAPAASPRTAAILRVIAPLVIWEYVLIAIALAVLHRTRLKRAAWVAVLLWALSSLARIGWYGMPPG